MNTSELCLHLHVTACRNPQEILLEHPWRVLFHHGIESQSTTATTAQLVIYSKKTAPIRPIEAKIKYLQRISQRMSLAATDTHQ
jgi:hypothetical protein